jgi:hypothetical protein
MNRNTPKPTTPGDAKKQESTENILKTRLTLLQLVQQLQMQALDADSKTSREAFEALVNLFHTLFTWLRTTALLSPMSLGALIRRLPEEAAWKRYMRGQHAAAWAGVELARFYKQIQAELRSRSKHFVNRLRDLRFGFKLATFDSPPNYWFRDEYERRTDYRPIGRMAVWVARKIEETRRLKRNRSEWQSYASIEIVEGHLRVKPENETRDVLADLFPSDLVQGESLKRLDDLPTFGTSNTADIEPWRRFVLRRMLAQKETITEFESLFPRGRKKLDGVVAATLRAAWHAVRDGGNVILPDL